MRVTTLRNRMVLPVLAGVLPLLTHNLGPSSRISGPGGKG